jgi:hypothetical protein
VPYFEINVAGDELNKELAFVEQEPENLGGYGFRLAEGQPTDDVYPEEAAIYLDPYSPGLTFASLLGNSIGFLMVCTAVKEVIAQLNVAPIELRPLAIYNHKRRLHSRDYWAVNPLAILDCVDRQRSTILYSSEKPTDIVAIDRLVFRTDRLAKAPDLFRIPERRGSYFASDRLLASLQGKGFTNIFVDTIEEAG